MLQLIERLRSDCFFKLLRAATPFLPLTPLADQIGILPYMWPRDHWRKRFVRTRRTGGAERR